jgi:hypothetical protein
MAGKVSDGDQPRTGVGRRRAMARIGAGGLATAVAVFARTSPASASNYGCCNLAHYPPTIDYNACINTAGHYVWSCPYNSHGAYCECCETPGDAQSGAACWNR